MIFSILSWFTVCVLVDISSSLSENIYIKKKRKSDLRFRAPSTKSRIVNIAKNLLLTLPCATPPLALTVARKSIASFSALSASATAVTTCFSASSA